ncbi:MAG: uracil-DNA glycosylase family protein [Rhodospirillaceae bacterium]|nr:uracil-DNA glycosylase family protein [Rhodospirillaceae bacterium]
MTRLDAVLKEARACALCAGHIPLAPAPVVRGKASSRILIVSQAPGTRAHISGLSFNDRSGDVLRAWMGVDRDIFYDESLLAVVSMGFCYPGRDAKGGDLPPRPECAVTWHPRIRPLLKKVELVLLVGSYAQAYYLKDRRKKTMTETIQAWRDYGPLAMPLPHPSWRNTGWVKKNPWFEEDLLPVLRKKVAKLAKP